ncbi:hypothetical protein LSH36_99g03009 [Paralvinella palmiformis]|uniref:Reverse transcriptase domain-containing protein n=1 Tax=Paralvinella palmiformis TaxID=53620 RepID=A0AAD9K040_9ANNE|nr:hypothetical protein LSH36_99g03009 [Paralvinella palmiformis]
MERKSHQDLPETLHKWVLEEMKFRNATLEEPLPTVQNFSEICKGEMAAIWQFVIKNVYSAHKQKQAVPYVRTYKVKYGSGEHFSQEKADLFDKHRALIAKIKSVKVSLGHIEKDFKETQTELSEIDQTYQQSISCVRDEQRKGIILRVHSQHIQQEVDKLDEYSNRLNFIVKNLRETSGKSVTDEKYYHHGIGTDPLRGIESTSTKDVRACCESVCTFLNEMLQGSYGTDMTCLGQHKNKLWSEVESVVDSHSPNQIMHSLLITARESAYNLKDKTSNIDIKKDAEKLRFKYGGTGQLSDLAMQPSLLKSIHQLLEDHQTQQIKNFIETENYQNKIQKLQAHLTHVQQLRDEALAQYYRNQGPATLELAKNVFETELQIATTHTAINCLSTVRESLKEKISLAMREKETLYDKYQKIQGFQKMADGKQNLIRVLVKQNLNARTRLENQQAEESAGCLRGLAVACWTTDHYHPCSNLGVGISEGVCITKPLHWCNAKHHSYLDQSVALYISDIRDFLGKHPKMKIMRQSERTFDGHEDVMRQMSETLKDSVKEEVDAFLLLSLPNLMFTVIDSAYRIAVVDLSINRLLPNKNTTTSHMIQKILKALEFPPYKAPEDLLMKVSELQCEIEDLRVRLKTENLTTEHQKTCEQNEIALVKKLTGKPIILVLLDLSAAFDTVDHNVLFSRLKDMFGLSGLTKELVDHDQRQIEELLPVLQKHLGEISQALTNCLHVKDLIQEWWEQPAQNAVSWIKVDDKSLQQWKDKWTVTVTQLRQLQVK